ncbi:MAG: CBS domain-containing protein, partial [Clostridia bacterium]|nr:CBS domain-containing protein [Clostridia bacterium]
KEEFAQKFTETKYSRLLVYEENIDKIVGVLHQKDFYIDGKITEQPLTEIISEPLFIPESEKINRLLKLLQTEKSHIAIVLDEYGGTLGIVTMEDILEELVGEIWDEHDEVVEPIREIDLNTYSIDASISVDDLSDFFDVDIETESTSVSGWITEILEKFPESGDTFTFENLNIFVTETESHCATVVEIIKQEPEEEQEENEEN